MKPEIVIIDPTVRQKQDILYANLKTIREAIAERINAEYQSQTELIRTELDKLEIQRQQFVDDAKVLLRALHVGARIQVTTQNGRGAANLTTHTGVLTSKDLNIGWFNMTCDGDETGERTIALNCCLQSIYEI
jgi:hypothetical protein